MNKYRRKVTDQLKSIRDGAKDMVKFEDVALSFFDGENISLFNKWKEKNKAIIVKEFEKLCHQHNCVYQKCYSGPLQGNYWISKRINNGF